MNLRIKQKRTVNTAKIRKEETPEPVSTWCSVWTTTKISSYPRWVIDTGVSSDMTNNLDLFINFETVKDTVRLGDDSVIKTCDRATVMILAQTSVRYGASRAPKPASPCLNSPPRLGQCPGVGHFFSTPAPAPVQAPAPFTAPNSPPSMSFLGPGPRFFVYSPLEHCSFDTWLSNCVSIYPSLAGMDRTPPGLRELKALCQGAPWCSVHSCQGRVPKTRYLKV